MGECDAELLSLNSLQLQVCDKSSFWKLIEGREQLETCVSYYMIHSIQSLQMFLKQVIIKFVLCVFSLL